MGDSNFKLDSNEADDILEIGDTLSIIPSNSDSFAVCELCGTVGDKRFFNQRDNRYCSLKCCISAKRRKYLNCTYKVLDSSAQMAGKIPAEPMPMLQHISEEQEHAVQVTKVKPGYDWCDEGLSDCGFLAAPIHLFKHAPLSEIFDDTMEGMKVEVRIPDADNHPGRNAHHHWVATVIKVKGYMGLVRYDGFGNNSENDFWVNLCGIDVHPVGWCATRGKPLIPPKCIEHKCLDWRRFLIKQLSGSRSLPVNFYTKFNEGIRSRFKIGTCLEVVDKTKVSQVRVARVHEIIGRRLHLKYCEGATDDSGFWCHDQSPLIHAVGWAHTVGHQMNATDSYHRRVAAGIILPSDATPDMFPKHEHTQTLFQLGMKLEAIDPLNLSAICSATVVKVLNNGYMMIRIDSYEDRGKDEDSFCYHQSSPCIFPVGFCAENGLKIMPPVGWNADTFTWPSYLRETGEVAAPSKFFAKRLRCLGFAAGMRLECADLMDPKLICVATVSKVVIDILKIHFNGWDTEYDQWLWAHSPDIYPVGWAKAVGHRLEGPRENDDEPKTPPNNVKKTTPKRQLVESNAKPKSKRGRVTLDRDAKKAKVDTCKRKTTNKTEPKNPPISNNRTETNSIEKMQTESTSFARNNAPAVTNSLETLVPPKVVSPIEIVYIETNTMPNNTVSNSDTIANPETEFVKASTSMNGGPLTMMNPNEKFIPRIVNGAVLTQEMWDKVTPETWDTDDVATFFANNDCKQYSQYFHDIDGLLLVTLSKEKILEKVENKVGPSLKVIELIHLLTTKKMKIIKSPLKIS